MENVPLPNSQSFCDGDCQQKMLNAGLLIALVVGIFTSIFLVVTLCKTFYNYTIPNVQEKILCNSPRSFFPQEQPFVSCCNLLIHPDQLELPQHSSRSKHQTLSISIHRFCFKGDDFPTLLDAIRRGFQIIAYICFYRMTCNYITPKVTSLTCH